MIAADVNEALPPGIPDKVDLVVVDPPRPGLSPGAIAWICKLTPDTIIYVSCNPSTLARDLKIQLFHHLQVVQILLRDLGNRNVIDIHFVFPDKVQKKVQRSVIDSDLDVQRVMLFRRFFPLTFILSP